MWPKGEVEVLYSSMTAALEEGEWSAACPCRTLPPGKTRYPSYRRLGGPQGRSGRAENLVPTGMRSRIVQPVVNRYTDWATRPTNSAVQNPQSFCGVSKNFHILVLVWIKKKSKFYYGLLKTWNTSIKNNKQKTGRMWRPQAARICR